MGTILSLGKWTPAKHLRLLSKRLVDVAVGRTKRLVVSMPPRHGKSNLISTWFPLWYLEHWQDRRIILTSYEASFASSFGRKVRNLALEHQNKLSLRLSKDLQAADWWETTQGGSMMTCGVGGALTGKGANILIVDDPIKNHEEAFSQTMREKTWEWWQTTAGTRLEPGGSAVVLMTRWHQDDLAGRLIETGDWEVLSLPAIAEDDDALGRTPGEPLWAERYDLDALEILRRQSGSYGWNALYQGHPSSPEGTIVKRDWWSRYTEPIEASLISVDCSFSGKQTSDFNVFQAWAKQGADCYLVAQERFKSDFPELLRRFKAFCDKHPTATRKLIEAKANGEALLSSVKREISGLVAISPKNSKESRVHAVSACIESGNVFLPNQHWVDDFIEEFASFPTGKHDDMVDAATQALSQLNKKEFERVITRV